LEKYLDRQARAKAGLTNQLKSSSPMEEPGAADDAVSDDNYPGLKGTGSDSGLSRAFKDWRSGSFNETADSKGFANPFGFRGVDAEANAEKFHVQQMERFKAFDQLYQPLPLAANPDPFNFRSAGPLLPTAGSVNPASPNPLNALSPIPSVASQPQAPAGLPQMAPEPGFSPSSPASTPLSPPPSPPPAFSIPQRSFH